MPIALTPNAQSIPVSRVDRWSVYRRLQELMIPCWCLSDGSLWVEINNSTTAILVRSVIQHCIAPRRELVTWLEHCWDAPE
ncbi:hypothetical protein H6G89_02445 [Oscillatoria sp. FACHB-1407]|nr:hypothetical protein [Oscillatoria sp. FACHB-1407]